ncbi:ABC transporter ATP-binding protein [Ruminococcaceae bacterium OttesenSCG-928-D13]|nr:ABC transporter ATP-binding protein [Ruminococcaceae bacterium OttesenSCG-928-D13]
MAENIIEMRHITKRFGTLVANEDVNLNVEKGEVHALLGENGAGKSTLMNCLYGMYDTYEGEIIFDGKPVVIDDPKHAIALGIGMVHQHFMLIPVLTVIENVVLGLKDNKQVLDLKGAAARFTELGKKYNMEIDPWAKVEQLSVGQQQRVEILKALYRDARLLILDEPTAVLTPGEIDGLFDIMTALKNEGRTVIFISHKLNEIMRICDRCTVLRLGRVEATVRIDEVKDRNHLAALMVGRDVQLITDKAPCQLCGVQLEVENLTALSDMGLPAVQDMSFDIQGGEILGICGVDGNGQSELVQCITGLRKPTSGTIRIGGQDTTGASAREVLKKNVSHIPEDRHKFGMIGPMNIEENFILVSYKENLYSKKGLLNWNWIGKHSDELVKDYNVKTPNAKEEAKNLSGGNQQKMVVGRELDRSPRLLVAVHPSRGLDIGATKYIQSQIVRQRDNGTAVMMVSTELDELMELSDRILVMYEGQNMGILIQQEATREKLGALMAGIRDGDED